MPHLDLKTISGNQVHLSRTWKPEAFADTQEEDYCFVGEVCLAGDVRKASDEYRLVGELSADLGVPCSRCLEPFRLCVETPFDVLYVPQDRNRGEGEREIAEEDLGIAFYADEVIDLGQLVREQCYLALPMKPLCRVACRGLCPQCGTNLNVATCDCRPDWVDPRLEPLRRLRRKSDRTE
ncbi:MAG: hypothetical protein GEU99_01730 [Luteitalea sp.]|nr:hypothetical protein [Luteitalea sp.]